MGVARSVAAFHLDRLVADGLLTTEFRRLTGRQGPGAGRPAKLYRRAEGEMSVSLPARQYDLAAGLLAAAVNDATSTGTPVGEALTRGRHRPRARRSANGRERRRGSGRAGAPSSTPPSACSTSRATNPTEHGNEIVLANCPFHALVDEQRDLVCGMNRDLLCGMADAVGDDVLAARLAPSEGNCCVRLDTKQRARRTGDGPVGLGGLGLSGPKPEPWPSC